MTDIHPTPSRVWNYIKENYDHVKEELFDPCPVNPSFDGLAIPWKNWNYVNPPYSLLTEFVNKAKDESKKGHYSLMLLPSWTSRPWFQELAKDHVFDFLPFRITFEGSKWHSFDYHFLVVI